MPPLNLNNKKKIGNFLGCLFILMGVMLVKYNINRDAKYVKVKYTIERVFESHDRLHFDLISPDGNTTTKEATIEDAAIYHLGDVVWYNEDPKSHYKSYFIIGGVITAVVGLMFILITNELLD